MGNSINKNYLIKGVLFSVLLMIGTVVGALMKSAGYNWVSILIIAGVLNIISAFIVFRYLKADLFPESESTSPAVKKSEGKGESTEKSSPKNATVSDAIEDSE